jgi:hypothetical protein
MAPQAAQQFGNLNIIDESDTLKDRPEIPKLTPAQIKQLDWLVKEYPSLDLMIIESILRLTDTQRNKIVGEIKDGTLKHEEPLPPEECEIIAVEVSEP